MYIQWSQDSSGVDRDGEEFLHFPVQCTVYSGHCTVYTLYTQYSIQWHCTQCILYTV